MRTALDLVLGHHEPFPALVVDRRWDLVRANAGVGLLLDAVDPHLLDGPVNVLRLSLHPDGLGGRVRDLGTFSGHVLARLRRQAALTGDPALLELHDELAGYPGVRTTEPWTEHPGVVLPFAVDTPLGALSFFTTMATFGTASDVTLSELMVEQFFPADAATDRVVRELSGSGA